MRLQDWWFTTLMQEATPLRPPLEKDIKADVAIVGAGAAGLSAALTLMNHGLSIVLLDRNICGGSSTGKSAGFLTPDSELELSQLVRRYGPTQAKQMWEAGCHGVELMLGTIKDHNINCDLLRQDSLFMGNDESGFKDAQAEAKARADLGYTQTLYSRDELPKVLGSTCYYGAVRYPHTYGVNGLRYSQGVKEVLDEKGVDIYEATEVISLKEHTLKTHLGSVTADKIIFTADKLSPTLTHYAKNIYHAQTFLSISEPLSPGQIQELFPDGPLQCWDSDLVYTYFRLTGDHRLLIGGGSMLTTFSPNDVTSPRVINRVIRKLKAKFPVLHNLECVQYWPGRIDCTRDLIPTVTRDPQSPWVHFVLGCVGLPWATFCGNFVALRTLDDRQSDKFYDFFHADRPFLFPLGSERILGKQLVFSLNNAWAKYHQVDRP